MREILFRGKRFDISGFDKTPWVYGSLIDSGNHEQVAIYPWVEGACSLPLQRLVYGEMVNVDSDTVGQYTGLKDKNGKRIFEGDICRFSEWSKGKMCWVGEVLYEHQQFIISGGANEECELPFVLQLSRFIPECFEVIGNVHDNPELIGGKEDGTGS